MKADFCPEDIWSQGFLLLPREQDKQESNTKTWQWEDLVRDHLPKCLDAKDLLSRQRVNALPDMSMQTEKKFLPCLNLGTEQKEKKKPLKFNHHPAPHLTLNSLSLGHLKNISNHACIHTYPGWLAPKLSKQPHSLKKISKGKGKWIVLESWRKYNP